MKAIKNFYNEHPYFSITAILIFCSIIGITIEYILNKDIIFAGIVPALVVLIISLWLKRKELRNKEK